MALVWFCIALDPKYHTHCSKRMRSRKCLPRTHIWACVRLVSGHSCAAARCWRARSIKHGRTSESGREPYSSCKAGRRTV